MTDKLRIVHCFRSPVGGIFRHVRDLCAAQVAAGHAVGIVCDSTTGGEFEARLIAEVESMLPLGVKRTPMQRHVGIGDLAAAWRTFKIIRDMRPDVLHGHGAKGGVYARLFGTAMRLSGQRPARVYSPHGGSLHYDARALIGRVFFTLERIMDAFCDHLLFVSEYERRTFERKVGRPRAPSTLVYNGLNEPEFTAVPARRDAADFLYIGMMRDLKGPDLFIEALARATKRTGRTLSAVMVGDGDGRDAYVAQAQTLGLGSQIAFLPAMPARQAFGLGRVMVVPSRAEAMPYIVLEALAAGRPLIASAVGGIPEVFGDNSPALVPPDSEALAEKMAYVLQDEQAYAARMPGRAELLRRFGSDVMARKIETAYLESLGRARR
ncbi:glycosyltransferase [Nitratireductor sp. ZSWI3]|uniref:glycosyltransferase n=1 Tax=Nitratireductor sp. ZSWI3 TaxID=2966359 RepID=UPI0021503A09|nr:glycosyltransferase [Nitratireductor sp. ZSWI3]MCR4266037.1 glycosyltransferase [Nitratireductor sp. ZSWI3]